MDYQLTQDLPAIMFLTGQIIQNGNNINLPSGSFKCLRDIQGIAQARIITVTGDGYIVARYNSNQNRYLYTYFFVDVIDVNNDCIVCVITDGLIVSYGNFYDYDIENLTNNNLSDFSDLIPNQQSSWYTSQVVTSEQMNVFSQDMYLRITQITQNCNPPCILYLMGDITQSLSVVTVPEGFFRFADHDYSFLLYNTAIFGNADGANITVTGDGYIVARYSLSPQTPNATNYIFSTTYVFVTSVDTITDCIICVVTAGNISAYKEIFNYGLKTIYKSRPESSVPISNLSTNNKSTSFMGDLSIVLFHVGTFYAVQYTTQLLFNGDLLIHLTGFLEFAIDQIEFSIDINDFIVGTISGNPPTGGYIGMQTIMRNDVSVAGGVGANVGASTVYIIRVGNTSVSCNSTFDIWFTITQ